MSVELPTGYQCRIEADSISTAGKRLTTFVVTYPRCIHAEMLTHRVFSRNSSSSRAVPVAKMLDTVTNKPFLPISWGKNQKGMQASEELCSASQETARDTWYNARDAAVKQATVLTELGVHKQIVNRLLEPFGWITVIISSTQWKNFFSLRCHPAAQPEMQKIANLMKANYEASYPVRLLEGQWHLPFVTKEEQGGKLFTLDELKKISSGRCARVSYLTHDGKRDTDADIKLGERLAADHHMSPLEHPATPLDGKHGNFIGWKQYRQELINESGQDE